MGEAARQLDLVLDRYRPIRPLGSGGSGSVWLARDERSGLDVALKIVPREGKAASRAEREAAAASRLRHERCQRAYALDSDASHVYIAYEYVPGRTLRQAMRAGELNDAQAVEAAAQALDGLAHAHARGIVHRDVKPANILLAESEGVSVKLLDFGLAQIEEADPLTATGDVPGTLAYISPERLSGAAGDPAADVWAVGVLLWEALAARHPFWGSSLAETATMISEGAPPLATERPDLPKHLLRAVDSALALDPARRPSALELAEQLRLPLRAQRPRREVAVDVRLPSWAGRVPAAVLPAAAAAWVADALPFFPQGWPPALGAAVAALGLWHGRLGLAAALAVPVLPLGNLAAGAALAYAALAAVLLAVCWAAPQAVRRAALAATAVVGVSIAGGIAAPIEGEEQGLPVLRAVVEALPSSAFALAALAAAGAALYPLARARGRWGIAAFGAVIALGALIPGVSPVPLLTVSWLTCAGLWLRDER